jgi:hypothetical protein
MTGEQLTAAIIKYAQEIAPGATLIVYGTTSLDDDGWLELLNASPYDMATVVHMATDLMVDNMSEMAGQIEALGAPGPAPAGKPS